MTMLAHNPQMLLGLLGGSFLLVVFVLPRLYFFVSCLGFMLAGMKQEVVWWRRVLAPLLSLPIYAVSALVAVAPFFWEQQSLGISHLCCAAIGALLFILLPLLTSRRLLCFSWLRSWLTAGLILLLTIPVFAVAILTCLGLALSL